MEEVMMKLADKIPAWKLCWIDKKTDIYVFFASIWVNFKIKISKFMH